MAKYSFEFKKQVVQAYLNGEGSYDYISQKHNMSGSVMLKKWFCYFAAKSVDE